jgi:hypothetical protein
MIKLLMSEMTMRRTRIEKKDYIRGRVDKRGGFGE